MKNFHAKVIPEIILSRKGIACISSTCYPYSVSTEVTAPTPGTEMTEDQVVGERVRTWLFRRHVMQRELAAHIGVTPGSYVEENCWKDHLECHGHSLRSSFF